jgi:NAD(P)-dependent dehydrogenase (short-subunit alcohol dehydrogenase family)
MEIKGKVFIVTGGASGLGEGTARMLASEGGKVVIADLQVEKGEALAREIGGAFVKCDVSDEEDGKAVVAKAVSMGKLMGLVNCAGIAPAVKTVGKDGAHPLAVYTKVISVNLIGKPEDYAKLVHQIITNDMLNGEVIRLDGAIRLAPR